jgi:hypothetical protein
MKTIASLLMRAKTLKRFGTHSAVEKQIAKIIEHPDLEIVCNLLESFQKLSFVVKSTDGEVQEDTKGEEELNEQDIEDLDLDITLDHDAEADVSGDILLVDDLLEDSDPYNQDEQLKEALNDEVESNSDYDDLEIVMDEEAPTKEDSEEEKEVVKEEPKAEARFRARAKLARAKLASKPTKIIVSKASIRAKKRLIG